MPVQGIDVQQVLAPFARYISRGTYRAIRRLLQIELLAPDLALAQLRLIGRTLEWDAITPRLFLRQPRFYSALIQSLVPDPGNARRFTAYERPGRHNYSYHQQMPESAGLAELLRNCPVLFPLIWGGCMPGGVDFEFTPEIRELLTNLKVGSIPEGLELPGVDADLTRSRDPVHIGNFRVTRLPDGTVIIEFCAYTRYGHALDGSVLHIMTITGDRIYLSMFGAGGNSLTSYYLNNLLATGVGMGTWPALARNMSVFIKGVNEDDFQLEGRPLLELHIGITGFIDDLGSFWNRVTQWGISFGYLHRLVSSRGGPRNRIQQTKE